jgi:hypothetical protein
VEAVPEEVTVESDALEFIDREIERAEMLAREAEWVKQLEAGTLDLKLLLGAALRLSDCAGRCSWPAAAAASSATTWDWARRADARGGRTPGPRARYPAGAGRRAGVGEVSVGVGDPEVHVTRPVQVIEGGPEARLDQYAAPTFYRLVNYEQVVRDREAINAWKPDVVVLDEAQRIKNWEAKTTRR